MWSYTADPSTNPIDAVRMEIGDTDQADPQLQDEEIGYMLSQNGTPLWAAVSCCSALAAKYARQADKRLGKTAISAGQRMQHYLDLEKLLRRRAVSMVTPYAGGMSIAERDTFANDTDKVRPAFTKDLHDDGLDQMPPVTPVTQ